MNETKKIEIDVNVLQGVLNYLNTRPYEEVNTLIHGIMLNVQNQNENKLREESSKIEHTEEKKK